MKTSYFLAFMVAIVSAGCANNILEQAQKPTEPAPGSPPAVAGCPVAPERKVDNSKAVIGTAVGAIGGALAGNAIDGKNTVRGAALGGLFGYLVGSQIAVREQRDGSVMLDIPGAALFDSNKADIKSQFASTLEKIAATLKENPSTIVCVIGYTDSKGSDKTNQDLSMRRAMSVTGFLSNKGVSSARLTAAGLGERFPVASNDDEAGRSQNRRVEMYVRN
ncbi:MAG: OmpA family protein [Burkholderiales bacterium]|jgi:outer membrane protein OmpA-like peptidoglycan-associated protein|nr:OmpA family protein [Burkholderiales bacterium]